MIPAGTSRSAERDLNEKLLLINLMRENNTLPCPPYRYYPKPFTTQEQIDALESEQRREISEFAASVQQRSHFVFQATEHLQTHPIIGCTVFDTTNLILDQIIPTFIPMLSLLLLDGKQKTKFPLYETQDRTTERETLQKETLKTIVKPRIIPLVKRVYKCLKVLWKSINFI